MTRARLFLVVLVWLLPASVSAQSARANHVAIGAFMVSSGADLAVTTYGLGAGQVREANPLLRWAEHRPVAMAVTKMTIAASVSTVLLKTQGTSRKRAFWVAVGLTALNTWVTVRNQRLIPERPR